jgi:hypothetical protein
MTVPKAERGISFYNVNPPEYQTSDPRYDHLTPEELLTKHIETTRRIYIPVEDICLKDTVIDEKHMEAVKQELEENGQRYDIVVRARFNEERHIVYDIIDGFYRSVALSELGVPWVRAVVEYGMSDRRMYDQRILGSHNRIYASVDLDGLNSLNSSTQIVDLVLLYANTIVKLMDIHEKDAADIGELLMENKGY